MNRGGLFGVVLIGAIATFADSASGATVTMTLDDDLSGATSGSVGLTIQDIGSNMVQVTLSPNFAAGSLQTITGLWLDDPGLGGVSVTPVSPLPNAYQSVTYSATQTLAPSGQTAKTGQYDTYVQFNNGSGAVIRGTTTEVFDITATSGMLNASLFKLPDAPNASGSPTNLYAVVGLTNYLATSGSGIGYIAATSVTAVPLPASLGLLLAGLGFIGTANCRRRSIGV